MFGGYHGPHASPMCALCRPEATGPPRKGVGWSNSHGGAVFKLSCTIYSHNYPIARGSLVGSPNSDVSRLFLRGSTRWTTDNRAPHRRRRSWLCRLGVDVATTFSHRRRDDTASRLLLSGRCPTRARATWRVSTGTTRRVRAHGALLPVARFQLF